MLASASVIPFPAAIILTLLFVTLSAAVILSPKQNDKNGEKQKQPLPPGPPALPVIGNLHMLGTFPHLTLQSLARKYGPIMSLRLGQVPAVVVSSSKAAELFLKTYDTVFASRPRNQATEILSYGSKGVVFSEYGPYWRNMRKLCTLHLLSVSKAESFAPLRREELGVVLKSLEKAAAAREVVDVTQMVTGLAENIVYEMVLGCSNDEQYDLKWPVREAMRLTGSFNLADFVPLVGGLDLQGFKRDIIKTGKAFDKILEKIIGEHEEARRTNTQKGRQDFVDILLSLMHQSVDGQNYDIDRVNIKAIVTDMIVGGLETSSSVIVWALSLLLRNPRVMKTLQDELEAVVGLNRQVEEETDLPKLSYLKKVVKETLRLNPPGAIIPRESNEDAVVDGYFIQKKTRIMLNIGTIARDPQVWSDPEEFYPERFNDKNLDFQGLDFDFLPFGSGRRGCPGKNLGLVTVRLVLAQLVHCFNWELPGGMAPDELDMSVGPGLSLPKAKNLLAVPTYRLRKIADSDRSY